MTARIVCAVLGIAAVVVGLLLLLVGLGLPASYCVSGTGIQESCTTDYGALAKAAGTLLAGLVAIGLGGRTAYRAL